MKTLSTLAVAVAMFTVTACGGGTTPAGVASLDDITASADDGSSVDPGEVDQEEAILAFTECLREQGLEVEDPTFDGAGGFTFNFGDLRAGGPDGERGPTEEFRAAFDECSYLMEGVASRFDQADRTQIEDSFLAFAECLRGEGLDVPDPDFSGTAGGPGGVRPFGGVEFDDPAAAAAFEKCQSELAFAGPGRGPGGFGGGNNGGDG